jgi:ribosomal protein S12 methylthiotransferase
MGRFTTPDDIRSLIARLRERVPGIVLRTSLIVGFPGEKESDFEELMDFMEETRFERLGAFVYSPEEGTRAASLDGVVPEEVAQGRYDELMRLQADISEDFHASLTGREFDMIVDEIDPDSEDVFGRTYMDAPEIDGVVSVGGGVAPDAEFVRVRIIDAGTYDLVAEPVEPYVE